MHNDSVKTVKSKKIKIFAIISFVIATVIFCLSVYSLNNKDQIIKFLVRNTVRYITGYSNVDYSKLEYEYNNKTKSFVVSIDNLNFRQDEKVKFIVYNLQSEINFSDVLKGFIAPRYTKINGGVLYSVENEKDSGKFKIFDVKWLKNLLKTIPDDKRDLLSASNIYIKSSKFNEIIIKNTTLKAKQIDDNNWVMSGKMISSYKNSEYTNSIDIKYKRKDFVRISVDLPPIGLDMFYGALGKQIKEYIGGLKTNLTFEPLIRINADSKGKVEEISVEFAVSDGLYHLEKFFNAEHKLKSMTGLIRYFTNSELLIFEKVSANFEKIGNVLFNATIAKNLSKSNSIIAVNLNDFDLENLDNYWPVNVAPIIKKAVINILPSGHVNSSSTTLIITPDWYKNRPLIDHVKAKIDVTNGTVNFHRGYDKITNANYNVNFDAEKVNFTVSSAKFKGLDITDAFVHIPFEKDSYVEIKSIVNGLFKDAVNFIPDDNNKVVNKLRESEGIISGELKMKVPLNKDAFNFSDLGLNLDLNIKHLNTKQNLLELPFSSHIKDSEAQFKLNGDIVNIQGNINMFDEQSNINFTKNVNENNINLKVNGTYSDGFRKNFSKEIVKIVPNGSFVFNADFDITDKIIGNLDIDFTKAGLDVSVIGFKKQPDLKFNFKAKYLFENGISHINDGKILYDDLKVDFAADFNDNYISSIDIKSAKSTLTDAVITYKNNGNFRQIDAKATKINLSQFFENKSSSDGDSGVKNLKVNFDLKNITAAKNKTLDILKHNLECNEYCKRIYFDAKKANDYLLIDYSEKKDNIKIESQNLGYMASSLGLSQNLVAGSMNADLKMTSNLDFMGEFVIKNIEFTENSILFAIVKLTSVTGILDALSNKNAKFDNIKGDMEFKAIDNLILLENVYANGKSISISSKGKYNIANGAQEFQGVLTPNLYGINNLMSKLPVIGGEKGFIGINYKISGTSSNRKINVNPLSILTPGILRNIIQW